MFIQNYNLLAEVEGFGQKLVESANGIIDEVEPEGDINKFLKDLNLKEYLVKFNDKEIDMNRLKTMKFDDLKALGVPLAGISLDNLLQSLCLKKYLKMFLDNNNIDINTLKQRNMSDLKALHIPIGPRMKLLEAIRFLRPAQSEIHTGLKLSHWLPKSFCLRQA